MKASASLEHNARTAELPKVQFTGTVAGVQACDLVTNKPEILVGSAADCDLVVMDPLVSRRALRVVHNKLHTGVHQDCGSCWTLEAQGSTRVYVNGRLVDRAQLAFGDSIAIGCHELLFSGDDHTIRARRTNVAISDLCALLIHGDETPEGFLKGLPSWRDWMRTRKAATCGMAAMLLLVLLYFVAPPTPVFEQTLPPLEVTVLGARTQVASGSVRSLSKVARKAFQTPPESGAPELKTTQAETLKAFAARPIKSDLPDAPTPKSATPERVVQDAGPQLATVSFSADQHTLEVKRTSEAGLGASAARRRLRTEQFALPEPGEALGKLKVQTQKAAIRTRTFTEYAHAAIERGTAPAAASFADARAANLAALQYKPSPVTFEQYRGNRIPVARVPEQLSTLLVGAGASGPQGITLDGAVSDAESSVSFKTGRFKVHAPGNPPEADPATYCYVSKTQQGGRDFLYVSFVCADPNLGALVMNEPGGTPGLAWDDSVEIFLDLNQDRADYHHIIVNARGSYFASHCANGDEGINGKGTPWDSGLQVKTTIDQAAGRWVCEVMVPFDRLPVVPSKGAEIPFNVCRNFRGQRSTNALQNWFSVYEGAMTNYHHPRLFGKLVWP